MLKLIAMLVLAVVLLGSAAGCKHHSGSREYIPSEGWVPND